MIAQAYYHVGIVVADLDRAIVDYADMLHLTFPQPRTTAVEQAHEGTVAQHEVRAVFSMEGPPYVELIENAVGVLGARHNGLHHFGYACDDVDEALRELREAGRTIEATLSKDGVIAAFFVRSAGPHGARIEYSSGTLLR